MSDSMMECPNCGKQFPTRLQEISDNGNPVCPECAKEEKGKKETEKKSE